MRRRPLDLAAFLLVLITYANLAVAATKLSITTPAAGEIIISVDPALHVKFGLSYPVTYKLSVPAGSTGLTAYHKHVEGESWTPLPQKTTSDYFNGEEAARFDYAANALYLSVAFESTSDDIFLRVTDGAGQPVTVTFQNICRYYDNRQAVVTLSADDWKEFTNLEFLQAVRTARYYRLPITTAIITGGCTANTWQTIQSQLDSGLVEAASHTRSHSDLPYADPTSEVIGSRDDLLANLTLPPHFRRGSQGYVYTFINPYGSTSSGTETLIGQAGYLINRLTSASSGSYTAWDPSMSRYMADGKTLEVGPLYGGITDVTILNSRFDAALAGGTIYHPMLHPHDLAATDEWSKGYIQSHFSYISGRKNVWYVNFGALYLYHILQDDAVGSVQTAAGPPVIVTQPTSVSTTQGQTATFLVEATGTAPLSYQWQRNGVPLPGATSAFYTTPSLLQGDSGAVFCCLVSNSFGSVTSSNVLLSIVPANVLVNASFESGTSPWSFFSNGSATFARGTTGSSGTGSASISITAEGTNVQLYQANITMLPNTEYRLTFDAYSNTGHDLDVTLCKHISPYTGYGLSSRKCDLGTGWQSYSITFTTSGFSNTVTDARLMFWMAPYDAAGDVYNIDNVVLARTADLTPPVVSPSINLQPLSQTVTAGQMATFSIAASGTSPLSYQWQRNNADITGATGTMYTTSATTSADSGALYHCRVTNAGGSVASTDAQLTVITPRPAEIILDPRDTTVLDGQSARFAVTASGTAPVSYQWEKNGSDIAGATASVYAVTSAPRSDSGAAFRCIVFNGVGKDTSNAAILHVQPAPPVITIQPAAETVDAGRTAKFSVVAAGSPPLSYQWQKDSVNISEATDTAYTTPAETSTDSGAVFRCVVTNMAGAAISSGAKLTVITPYPPVVVLEPRDTTVQDGHSAHFTISATGTAPLSYQWQKNEADIQGATGATYGLAAASRSDSGATFRCIVASSVGRDTSNAAILHVLLAPPAISVQPMARTVTVGQTATFSLRATGTSPLEYQWQKNGADIAGATDTSYTTPVTTAADSGAMIRCIVSNIAGKDTSAQAFLGVNSVFPAVVTIDPHDSTIVEGRTATFTVVATGTAPLAYRWQKNGADIIGGTAASYTTGTATFSDSGTAFRCVISNSVGKDTSAYAYLRVLPLPPTITAQPTNQNALVGYTATFSVVAGSNAPLRYQWQKNGTSISDATGATYTTPAAVPADSGAAFRCVISNSGGSVTSQAAVLVLSKTTTASSNAVANGSFESGTASWNFYSNGNGASAISSPGSGGSGSAMQVSITTEGTNVQLYQYGITLQPNTSYQLSFDACSNTGHDVAVSVSQHGSPYANYGLNSQVFNLTPSWQTFTVTFTTSGFSGTVTDARLWFWMAPYDAAGDKFYFDNVQLAKTSDLAPLPPTVTQQPTNQSVSVGQSATFSVTAGGAAPLSYQWQKNSVDISGAASASYTTPATTAADSGALFRCRVTNSVTSVFSSSARLVAVTPQPPVVTTNPRDTTVLDGSPALFAVAATGSTPLTYQWQKNGANISEATGATYSITSAAHADSGALFRCLVSNGAGKDTSTPARLSVLLAPPIVTAQPADQSVAVGQTAAFAVSASGSAPLTYQWQKNDSPIPGATGATYTTPATVATDSGSTFRCVITNPAGSRSSQIAVLNVASAVQNLLTNGTFESGTTGWSFYTNGAGSFSSVSPGYSGSGSAMQVSIATEGTNVQFYQYGITLQANTSYQLKFNAYSNSGHDIDVSLSQHVSPYAGYGLSGRTVNLTTAWQSFTMTFTTSGFSGTVSDARLWFWMAPYDAAGDKFYFDDIVLAKSALAKSAPDGESLAPPLASIIPVDFVLEGNFPNPFNPSTVVRYGLPEPATVSLVVYNILGQEIARLSDGFQPAGTFEVVWNGRGGSGSALGSGVYLCRMVATATGSERSYVATKRMMLIR